jgi:uncharacterized membrane protein
MTDERSTGMRSLLLFLHIVTGTLGVLSGFVAVWLRKGSARHALAGNIFVVSMLTLSATGFTLALMKHEPGNVLGGALTFYLVATAWVTARRGDAGTGMFDWCAPLVVLPSRPMKSLMRSKRPSVQQD